MRRSEAKHNAGQPTAPRWLPSGRRRRLPLLPRPTFPVLGCHPVPVDLSALCNECEIFGRCIAGRGLSGNMGYFIFVIMMGQLGWLTALASIVVSIIYRT